MNPRKTTILTVILSVFLVMILLTVPAGADTVIIHTNDVHGQLTDNIGYDGLAAYIEERTAAGDEIILFDAGDAFQGKVEVNAFEGASALDIMNTLGYDAMAVGNHDFEFKAEGLFKLRDNADFPLLAANVFYEDTGEPAFSDSVIIPASDYKIGVFGLSTPYTKVTTREGNTDNLVFVGGEQLYEIARHQVDALKEEGCDFIICLGHLGIGDAYVPDSSKDVAEHVKGIDLLIDGHSHTELPGGVTVGDTLIVSAGSNLKNIGVVTLKDGKMKAELVSDYDKKDENITALCESYINSHAEVLGSIVVGETKVYLDSEKEPGCRTGEDPFGNLITDALLYTLQQHGYDPDCALLNGGAIRDSIPIGEITELLVHNVFPFDDDVYVVSIPGSVLLQAFEKNTALTPSEEAGFPQVSGIEYTIDTSKPYVESEIHRVTINSVNGKPFNPESVYAVATTDFIATGGDKYTDFIGCESINTGIKDVTAFDEFVSNGLNGVVDERYAKPAGRIHVIGNGGASAETQAPTASPAPLFAVLAGLLAAGAVFGLRRR